jgi:NAD(P)-dependent dehydrogenase (short-subunit alcohol dehydrogenase family)
MPKVLEVIWGVRKQKYFCKGDSTLICPTGGFLGKARGACHRARIGAIPPGTVYFKGGVWHMVEQNNPKRYHDTLARNPSGRMATPQEIANAAVFLASPASSFTTGSNLVVDGAISNRVNF